MIHVYGSTAVGVRFVMKQNFAVAANANKASH
jgi:hypothetical protein